MTVKLQFPETGFGNSGKHYREIGMSHAVEMP